MRKNQTNSLTDLPLSAARLDRRRKRLWDGDRGFVRSSLIASFLRGGLATLGVGFLFLFLTSGSFRMGVPGFPWLREAAYLLLGNLNTDLRDGFVWFDRLPTFEAIETFTPRVAVSGFADGVVQWNTPQGVFWMPPSEGPVALRDMLGNIEKEIYSYKGQTVKPGQIVLDCGAHLGSFVRFALNKGAATVIAIEPSALKVACLRKTFASEVALGRVRVEQVAVWSKEDKLWLAGDPSLVNSVLEGRPGVGHGEWVRTLPIDQLVKVTCLAFLVRS